MTSYLEEYMINLAVDVWGVKLASKKPKYLTEAEWILYK